MRTSMFTAIEIVVQALIVSTTGSEAPMSLWVPLMFVTVAVVLTVGSVLLLEANRRRTYKLLLEYTPPNTALVGNGRRGQQVICARGHGDPYAKQTLLTERQ